MTDKSTDQLALLLEILSDYIGEIRSVNGMGVPPASDDYGHISTQSATA
jgi:hypothetical protein